MPHKGGRAFTIIELLVVISVIAILAGVVTVTYGQSQTKAKNSVAMADTVTAGKAVDLFRVNNMGKVIAVKQSSTILTDQLSGAGLQGDKGGYGYGFVGASAPLYDLTQLFTGVESNASASLTYGTKITKTPGNAYTYSYATSLPDISWPYGSVDKALVPLPALLSDGVTPGCYLFQVTILDPASSDLDHYFFVRNGEAGSVKPYPNGGANCSRP